MERERGVSGELADRLRRHLERIYPDRLEVALEKVQGVCREVDVPERPALWTEEDVLLITYGDQIRGGDAAPLKLLRRWLLENDLRQAFSLVHLLPFFPYSSDDGFSVIDYRRVDPALGDWNDVAALADSFDLMFDLVLNHVSQKSEWFQRYLKGDERYADWFIEADPTADYSQVVRPRSLPLLTPFETARGTKHIWTTFSPDQVDLNYRSPDVLAEMLDILLLYVERGARILRLDAIAYLWKELGTSCIHLPQTHEVVKLMRTVLDACAPGTLLLTETNVPHQENISYFGNGDEAHIVYQFSLPPLLLDAIVHGDATYLRQWLSDLAPPAPATTFLNFTASHDGIGVRPLEGIVPPERLQALVAEVRKRGGLVSTRRQADGSDAPYELNITYLDAVRDLTATDPRDQLRPFLASQSVMLALQGIPAVYFHSLVGTPNDTEGVERSGQPRRINRHKYTWDELAGALESPESSQGWVFRQYRAMLQTRRKLAAFHPEASQRVLDVDHPAVLAVVRGEETDDGVALLANLGREPVSLSARQLRLPDDWTWDCLRGETVVGADGTVALDRYETVWLTRPLGN